MIRFGLRLTHRRDLSVAEFVDPGYQGPPLAGTVFDAAASGTQIEPVAAGIASDYAGSGVVSEVVGGGA